MSILRSLENTCTSFALKQATRYYNPHNISAWCFLPAYTGRGKCTTNTVFVRLKLTLVRSCSERWSIQQMYLKYPKNILIWLEKLFLQHYFWWVAMPDRSRRSRWTVLLSYCPSYMKNRFVGNHLLINYNIFHVKKIIIPDRAMLKLLGLCISCVHIFQILWILFKYKVWSTIVQNIIIFYLIFPTYQLVILVYEFFWNSKECNIFKQLGTLE